jgi:hypothetical protein
MDQFYKELLTQQDCCSGCRNLTEAVQHNHLHCVEQKIHELNNFPVLLALFRNSFDEVMKLGNADIINLLLLKYYEFIPVLHEEIFYRIIQNLDENQILDLIHRLIDLQLITLIDSQIVHYLILKFRNAALPMIFEHQEVFRFSGKLVRYHVAATPAVDGIAASSLFSTFNSYASMSRTFSSIVFTLCSSF